jgi:hypothetical protein
MQIRGRRAVKETLTGGTQLKGKARQNRREQRAAKRAEAPAGTCDWRNGGTHGPATASRRSHSAGLRAAVHCADPPPCFWLPASKSTLDSQSPLLCPLLGRKSQRSAGNPGSAPSPAPHRRAVGFPLASPPAIAQGTPRCHGRVAWRNAAFPLLLGR